MLCHAVPHRAARLVAAHLFSCVGARRNGPLIDGWLWGGAYNARRKLSEYEIETMVTKLEREDIINAVKPEEHGRSSMLRACRSLDRVHALRAWPSRQLRDPPAPTPAHATP